MGLGCCKCCNKVADEESTGEAGHSRTNSERTCLRKDSRHGGDMSQSEDNCCRKCCSGFCNWITGVLTSIYNCFFCRKTILDDEETNGNGNIEAENSGTNRRDERIENEIPRHVTPDNSNNNVVPKPRVIDNKPDDRKPRVIYNLPDDPKPRGLYNLGNTCYFNSVMQPLCKTDVFYSVLRNANQQGKLTRSFLSLMKEMEKKGTGPFDPTKVRNDFVKNVSRFDNRGQHDGHECLRHFLDEIRKEERKTMAGNSGKSSLTTVDKVFGGHLVTVYVCKECLKHYHLFEPCLDVSLPVFFDMECIDSKGNEMESNNRGDNPHEGSKIPANDDKEGNYKRSVRKLIKPLADSLAKDYYTDSVTKEEFNKSPFSKKAITLDDCFRHFSRVEQIKGEYLCEDCLGKAMALGEADEDNLKLTSGTKQSLIFNPPAILTIHFKRFELLPGRSRKRSDMVKYPKYLDIAPYCSSHCLRNDPPRNNIWYSLYAVAVHSGSLESGHYVAYVKVRKGEESIEKLTKFLQREYFNHNVTSEELIEMINKEKQAKKTDAGLTEREEESKWYLMNDSSVSAVSIQEVLSREAYLLFYERVINPS